MERVVDRMMKHIVNEGVNHVFMVAGGGAMFINDAVDKNEDMEAVYLLHEQSCAIAAVGYGKTNERPFGVALGTSGCGSTNMLTGLLEAWQDGTPCLFISGNANLDQIHNSEERHYGVQDLDLEPIVSPMTKAFFRVSSADDIDKIMEMAINIMIKGNPGPVWIEIPIDIQSKTVYNEFIPTLSRHVAYSYDDVEHVQISEDIKNALRNSKRPLVLFGAGYNERTSYFGHKCPIVSTFGATHKVGHHRRYIGAIGLKGDRLANMAMYYADTILVLGSSLSIPAIGYNFADSFGHCKNLIIVDKEVQKFKKRINLSGIENVYFVSADASAFYNGGVKKFLADGQEGRYNWTRHLVNHCSIEGEDNSNALMDRYNIKNICSKIILSNNLNYHYLVTDTGSAYYVISKLKGIKSHISSTTQLAMGAALPYAIGAYYATGSPVYAFTGDGSFQMNSQDLGSLVGTKIKLFVLNNDGYLSIRSSQNKFADGENYGTNSGTDLKMPDLKILCESYGVSFSRHYKDKTPKGTQTRSRNKFEFDTQVNEIMCNPDEDIYPRVEARKNEDGSFTSYGFKNMYPFLSDALISKIEKDLGLEETELDK